jgi:hypothetical protein
MVEKEMSEVSPLIGLLEKLSLKTDSVIINFSLDKARQFAWDHAVQLAPLSGDALQAAIRSLDAEAADLGHLVVSPPWLIKVQLLLIRIFESSNVRRVLDVLAGGKPAAAKAAPAG